MSKIKYLLFCIFLSFKITAQQNYFQQEVNYTIDVTLNDVTHELSAFEEIQYINKSTTSLEFIYFHLWFYIQLVYKYYKSNYHLIDLNQF